MISESRMSSRAADAVGREVTRLHFFTIVARNYIAHADVLGKSVLRYHPDATFSVFLVDDREHDWQMQIQQRGFQAIYPEQIPLPDYKKFVFQYSVTEASTGVKPFVIQHLFECGADKVIYLDPDILCFRRFDEVLHALDEHCIVLTPHISVPVNTPTFPDEGSHLRTGVFNLGFIALRKTQTAESFVTWWSEHLKTGCLCEPDAGLFVDQKWIDLVPACFDEVFILRNKAYNIAYWNLHERILEEREGVLYERSSDCQVAFIHFSGYSTEHPDRICNYPLRNPFSKHLNTIRPSLKDRPDLVGQFRLYHQLLLASGAQDFRKYSYGYGRYDNGEPISQLERSLYLTSGTWREAVDNPFASGHGTFQDACRKSGVLADTRTLLRPSASEIVKIYRFHISLIEFILRFLVRWLGPVRYFEFAKYMRNRFLPANQGFLLKRVPSTQSQHPAGAAVASEGGQVQPQ